VSGDSLVNGASIYYYDGLLTGEEISYTNNYATAVVLITEPVTYIPGTPTLPGGTTYTPIPLPTPVVPTPVISVIIEQPKTIIQKVKKILTDITDYIYQEILPSHPEVPVIIPKTGSDYNS